MNRNVWLGYGLALVLGAGGGFLVARGKGGGQSSLGAASCFQSSESSAAPDFVEIDGQAFSEDKVPQDLRRELAQAQRELFERRSDIANRAALRIILAKEAGKALEPDAIPELSELIGEGWVKDDDIRKFYEDNKKNLPATMTYEQLAPSLKRHLEMQKTMELIRGKVDARRKEGKFRKLFSPPCGRSETIDTATLPSRGEATAKNTVVVVSDYGCNLCRSLYFSMEGRLEQWDKSHKLVHVPFSAKNDELGTMLVKGAQCAFELDAKKYWTYNREAYIAPLRAQQMPQARELTVDVAKRSGFDADAFGKCLDAGSSAHLEKGNAIAKQLGVTENPAIFVNGKELVLMGNDKVIEFLDGL